jgi:Fic family protein
VNYKRYLKEILNVSEWSQERLAQELGVSFATLNSWVRDRSVPRIKAQKRIELLFFSLAGNIKVSNDELEAEKLKAIRFHITANEIVSNKKLLDTLTLQLTYHTNTIEGSTMTLSDVGEVLFDNKILSNRTAIEQTEVRNHQAVLNWLLDQISANNNLVIDETFIKNIHLRLMNGIVSDAGQFRNHSVRIQGSRTTVSNWMKIPDLIKNIHTNIDKSSNDIISILAKFHADFEKIHPFSDGNGRTGRLILLVMALQAQIVPPIILKERKHAYYKYLEVAQMNENYKPLELFIASSIISTDKILR